MRPGPAAFLLACLSIPAAAQAPAPDAVLKTGDELSETGRLKLDGAVLDMELSEDGAWIYALDASRGQVLKVATASMTAEATVDVGEDAVAMACPSGGDSIYVLSRVHPGTSKDEEGKGLIQAIATDTMKVRSRLKVPGDPVDLEVARTGTAWVIVAFKQGNVAVVDAKGKAQAWTAFAASSVGYLHLHPDQARLYTGDVGRSHSAISIKPGLKPADGRLSCWRTGDHVNAGSDFVLSKDGGSLLSSTGLVLKLDKVPENDLKPRGSTVPWTSAACSTGFSTFFVATAEGFVKQYDLGTLELQKSFPASGACLQLALDAKRSRLYAFLVATESFQRNRDAREIGWGDLVAWSLEGPK